MSINNYPLSFTTFIDKLSKEYAQSWRYINSYGSSEKTRVLELAEKALNDLNSATSALNQVQNIAILHDLSLLTESLAMLPSKGEHQGIGTSIQNIQRKILPAVEPEKPPGLFVARLTADLIGDPSGMAPPTQAPLQIFTRTPQLPTSSAEASGTNILDLIKTHKYADAIRKALELPKKSDLKIQAFNKIINSTWMLPIDELLTYINICLNHKSADALGLALTLTSYIESIELRDKTYFRISNQYFDLNLKEEADNVAKSINDLELRHQVYARKSLDKPSERTSSPTASPVLLAPAKKSENEEKLWKELLDNRFETLALDAARKITSPEPRFAAMKSIAEAALKLNNVDVALGAANELPSSKDKRELVNRIKTAKAQAAGTPLPKAPPAAAPSALPTIAVPKLPEEQREEYDYLDALLKAELLGSALKLALTLPQEDAYRKKVLEHIVECIQKKEVNELEGVYNKKIGALAMLSLHEANEPLQKYFSSWDPDFLHGLANDIAADGDIASADASSRIAIIMPDSKERDHVLKRAVKQFMALKDHEKAWKVVSQISKDDLRVQLLQIIEQG